MVVLADAAVLAVLVGAIDPAAAALTVLAALAGKTGTAAAVEAEAEAGSIQQRQHPAGQA
jgi:hypothetical protein